MIKKYGTLLLIIILIIALFMPLQNVYATDSFFEVKEKEVTKEDKAQLIINLDKIIYSNFKFELISDIELSNVNTDEDIELKKNNNEIYIVIDKEVTNLNKIILEFKIPEDKKIGDIIKFIANIINLKDEKETQTEQTQITIIEDKQQQEGADKEKEENQKPREEEKNEEQNAKEEEKLENENSKIPEDITSLEKKENNTNSSKSIQSTQTTMISSNQTSSAKQMTTAEVVTYNGSNNNYLSNLSIDGFYLNKEFCKDSDTYFVNIDRSISSINIITEKEDNTATICIYGNEDLKEGTNKILVNVTAENGNVRTYRIYVTVKA